MLNIKSAYFHFRYKYALIDFLNEKSAQDAIKFNKKFKEFSKFNIGQNDFNSLFRTSTTPTPTTTTTNFKNNNFIFYLNEIKA